MKPIEFDTIDCVYQYLKRYVDDIITIALSSTIRSARTAFHRYGTIDKAAHHRTMAAHSQEDQWILKRLQFQANWSAALQAQFYETPGDGKCMHRGHPRGVLPHL